MYLFVFQFSYRKSEIGASGKISKIWQNAHMYFTTDPRSARHSNFLGSYDEAGEGDSSPAFTVPSSGVAWKKLLS